MAWTSMHFAVGMLGGAAVMAVPCLILRRGWRHIPVAMTLGGLWALIPDAPRLWREDFTSLPFAATLGSKDLELWLHSIGDLFFFHRSLDSQPKEFALLGLALIIGLYNLSLIGLLWHGRRHRRQAAAAPNRLNAPAHRQAVPAGDRPPPPQALPQNRDKETQADPVIGRIGSGQGLDTEARSTSPD